MKKYFKWFFENTKFFIKQSRYYVAPFRLNDYLYYPVAYIKFMYYSMGDL